VDLIESAKPGDVYSAVADRVKELLAKDAESHSDPENKDSPTHCSVMSLVKLSSKQ